jgi:hypothetical protein
MHVYRFNLLIRMPPPLDTAGLFPVFRYRFSGILLKPPEILTTAVFELDFGCDS